MYQSWIIAFVFCFALVAGGPAMADSDDADMFKSGWTLNGDASDLRALSIKNKTIAESSPFRNFSGQISDTGSASINIVLDSIDTGIDIRNVRMRFLFFETFKHPEATISTRIDPQLISDLNEVRTKTIDLPYTLDLRGVQADRTDAVTVTLIDQDTLLVMSARPIPISVGDFDLARGLQKLQEAAQVEIVPIGTISFRFQFARNTPLEDPLSANATASAANKAQEKTQEQAAFSVSSALFKSDDQATPIDEAAASEFEAPVEPAPIITNEISLDACQSRFKTLDEMGGISFRSGSGILDPSSMPYMRALLEYMQVCAPVRIEIGGHTDSDGPATYNVWLSKARADAVKGFLVKNGVPQDFVDAVGYGAQRPLVPNTSDENKQRNRRIELTVLEG